MTVGGPAARGAQAWRVAEAGVVVRVRVTPKSSRVGIDGVEATADGPAFKVRVRDVPEDGKANRAVIEVLAKSLGCPRSAVTLVTGARGRIKTFAVAGEAKDLAAQLERLAS